MKRLIPLLLIALTACQLGNSTSTTTVSTSYPPEQIPTVVALTAKAFASPTSEVIDIPTPGSSATATLTTSPTPTTIATLGPHEKYTIDGLRQRTYGGGDVEVLELMEQKDSFVRYLIRYPSDGLMIYGFVNIPKGEGPFPIIIVIHGYGNTAEYQTLDYTTDAADRLTESGYIVIHPNLRNYPPSDKGDNLFRVGIAVDVLNLIALVRSESMPTELSAIAAIDRIGLWGHSLGGNVVLRVLTVSSDVKAAVLYASLSGDEFKNSAALTDIGASEPQLQAELVTAPALLQRISPSSYYENITTPIQIYHGTNDSVVPFSWAQETCRLLKDAAVTVDCIYYTDEDHTFRSRISDEFYGSLINFYQTYLSP
jgi:uncharacterized protein